MFVKYSYSFINLVYSKVKKRSYLGAKAFCKLSISSKSSALFDIPFIKNILDHVSKR